MATQSPITFVGTFPNITGLTQLKTGDTLAGVVNHQDFSPNSVMFADSAGTVAAAVLPENTVLGNTGTGPTSLTMATLAPLVAKQLSIDDLFTVSGLVNGDTVAYNSTTGTWYNLPNSLGSLIDVASSAPSAGDFLVYSGSEWVPQAGPPVDGRLYGYQNGEWSLVPLSTGGGGTLDHSALGNLLLDTHTQYHNDARGDVRYYQKSEVDTLLSGKADTSHQHVLADITDSGALAAKDQVDTADISDEAVSLVKIDPTFSQEGQIIRSTGAGTAPTWDSVAEGVSLTVTANSTGIKNYFVSTKDWRITGWYLVSSAPNTTLELDVIKATGAVPTELQTIVGSEPPTLSNAQLSSDLALATWSDLDVATGDVIGVKVVSTNAASELATLSIIGYQL